MYEFIEIKNSNLDIEKRDTVFSQFKRFLGDVPPHFKLLGNINPDILSDFLKYNLKLARNKKFHPEYFVFLRLHTALNQDYGYCKYFNSNMLLKLNYDLSLIEKLDDIDNFPVDENLKLLAKKSYKAVFDSSKFNEDDLKELYDLDWEINDIFEVIDHIALLEKNSRIIKAFLIK